MLGTIVGSTTAPWVSRATGGAAATPAGSGTDVEHRVSATNAGLMVGLTAFAGMVAVAIVWARGKLR